MKYKNIIKKTMACILSLCFIIIAAYPITCEAAYGTILNISESKPAYGVVNIDSGTLNVRQSASATAGIITGLSDNTYVMVVGVDGAFYKIMYDTAGNYGYVSKTYIDYRGDTSDKYIKVNNLNSNLNMRKLASTSSEIVASIPSGGALAYLGNTTGWYLGVYGIERGYVSSDYTQLCDY